MTRDEYNVKVRKALAALQTAQSLILDASQELCPLDGAADEWSRTGKLYDTVKAHWHDVNALIRHDFSDRNLHGCQEGNEKINRIP